MDPSAPGPELALEMSGVSKRYGQALVLDDVSFRVRRGSVHGLVGHNGAGKSTLMKIALGGVAPTTGTVRIGDTALTFSRPAEAREAGVGMVLQELSLIPTLSVADNIFLNDERHGPAGLISADVQRREASELLAELGISSIRPSTEVGRLGVAEQQMVEIAKAVRLTEQLLILDEPTAPLSHREIGRLFDLVRRIAARSIGVVFITHHLREIFEVCDEVSVLREGRIVLSAPTAETNLDDVVNALVGSELARAERPATTTASADEPPILAVRDLSVRGKLDRVGFEVRKGEIVGVAGLAGSGRSILLQALFGQARAMRADMTFDGRPYRPRRALDAIRAGVFLIPEDRRVHGIVLTHSILDNMVLSILRRLTRIGFWRPTAASEVVRGLMERLQIRATGPRQVAGELSGGNQQKVVMAKALAAEPRLFLLDEPTFGVDVRTAAEIIELVRAQCAQGRAAVWVSSDLAELLHVADRILILVDGGIRRVIERDSPDFTEEAVLRAIQRGANGRPGPAAAAGAPPVPA